MSQTQLDAPDQRAIDMLLNHLPHFLTSTYSAALTSVEPQRLEAARKVLHLLDALEVPEPPADLTTRTLNGIARAPKLSETLDWTPRPAHFDA